jgi:hypothetical protein
MQIVHMECLLFSKLEEKNRLNLDIVQTLFKLKLLALTCMFEFELFWSVHQAEKYHDG